MVHERKKRKWVTQKHSSCLFDNLHEVNNFSTFDSLVSMFQALGQTGPGAIKKWAGKKQGLVEKEERSSFLPWIPIITDPAHRWPCLSLILLIADPACRLPASCFDHPGYNNYFSQCSYFISHLLLSDWDAPTLHFQTLNLPQLEELPAHCSFLTRLFTKDIQDSGMLQYMYSVYHRTSNCWELNISVRFSMLDQKLIVDPNTMQII